MHFHRLHLRPLAALAFFITCGCSALQGGPEDEAKAEIERGHAETLRLADSSRAEDRALAVARLRSSWMDFDVIWKLMHDSDASVRLKAIEAISGFSCTVYKMHTLELAQKMVPLLEKEITPERIKAAFKPGAIHEPAASFVIGSALALESLYVPYPQLMPPPADRARWEEAVLQPLITRLAAARRSTSDSLDYSCLSLLRCITDASLLMKDLEVLAATLDDEKLPPQRLLYTLEILWLHHPLLGEERPLNLMLLAQLGPRLPSLKQRILGPLPEGPDKEQAANLFEVIAFYIQAAREKLSPQPAPK